MTHIIVMPGLRQHHLVNVRAGLIILLHSRQRMVRPCLSLLQVSHSLYSIPQYGMCIYIIGIVSGCYDDDFESSAAESGMESSDGGSCHGDDGDGDSGGHGDGSHGDGECDELTLSFKDLSELCSSLEDTLNNSSHDEEEEDEEVNCELDKEIEDEEEMTTADGVILQFSSQKDSSIIDSHHYLPTSDDTLSVITEKIKRLDPRYIPPPPSPSYSIP